MNAPTLLSALHLRGVTLPNRLVVAPMCRYSVTDGLVGDHPDPAGLAQHAEVPADRRAADREASTRDT